MISHHDKGAAGMPGAAALAGQAVDAGGQPRVGDVPGPKQGRLRILLLVTGMSMGGAERVVADLADTWVEDGHQVRLVYMKKPLQVRPRRAEVELTCLGMDSWLRVALGYQTFLRILREFQPHIVHSHMFHATMLARLARLRVRVPHMISTMHAAYDGGRLRTLAYRFTDRLTDISTNVSQEAADIFFVRGGVPAGRMIVIHNGIPVDRYRPSPSSREQVRARYGVGPDCRLLLAVGRLARSKDYPNMFAALARLPAESRYLLLIAGDGSLRSELERSASALGLSSKLRFLGIRDDIPELMAAADVFVLSSVAESFGLVVAEAMACECVVVATDSGGIKEVLGDAGYLVPSNAPEALAAALNAALSLSSGQAARLGHAARQRVIDHYSFERSIDAWRGLYAELIEAPAGRTAS